MAARWILGAICIVIAAPAAAQSLDDIDRDYLVQVRPGPKRYFYQDYDDGCPAVTAKCRRPAYVLPGDLLVASEEKGGLTNVEFVNARGTASWGWVEAAGLVRVPAPRAGAWLGNWSRTEADIEFKPGRRAGRLLVHGDATWGMSDPERVKRGGVNLGEFDGEIGVTGDRVIFVSGDVVVAGAPPATGDDEYDCRVRLRLLGPYLLAKDNNHCGGNNVSFSGVYRKL
jgi:hypothetical protein